MDAWQVFAVAAVFALAGVVKGATGMGLPTVAVSLLGLWMAPMQAAALLVLPSMATNLAQCAGPHWRTLSARLWPVWLALAVVTVAAPALQHTASVLGAQRALGAVLVVYGLFGLCRPVLEDLSRPVGWRGVPIGAVIGVTTGFVTAVTAVFVMPLVPYLQALRLDRETMVQALGMSFTVATLALALRLQGADHTLLSPWSALALAAACAGLRAGARLRQSISALAFQRALFVVFIGLGAANLLRGA